MPYIGQLFIFLATVCAAASAVLYFLAWRGKENLLGFARRSFLVAAGSVIGALATLLYLILTHNFTVAYVYSYSSTDLPLGYLIATLWGGQEGTFLLWIFYVSILGIIMMRTAKNFEKGNMFFLNLFLLTVLFILLKRSPFELMPVYRSEGAGLNPLLQNFWMQIHPPIMFTGFAAALFPFLFGMTGLVERKYDQWGESARKWTMFAWIALGTSLVMGGYWAYITLGWGGFWAWDPVENSSFIPWIFLAAQVHVLFIKRQRRGLMRFSLFIVCLSFWSVLYGTFLTRSGVLADFSVHSFVDLGINNFLIGGLFFFILLGTFLLIYRWRDIKPNPAYSKVNSRSYLVTLGIVLLSIGGALTLVGTSSPLLTRLATKPSNVGLPYYFATMTPVAIAVLILLGLFPAFRWNEGLSRPKLLIVGGATFLATVVTILLTGFTHEVMYICLFASAAMAFVVNSYVLISAGIKDRKFKPAYLAHVGLALGLTGAALANGFETKQTITLPQGKQVEEMGYTLKFVSITDNPKGFDCHVQMSGEGRSFMAILPHEFPKNEKGVMRKPFVEKYLTHDIYIAPVGMEQPEGADPSEFELEKGGSKTIDKYEITFHDFKLTSHEQGGKTTAQALLTVKYGDKSEDINPALQVIGDSVATIPATFDYGRGTVAISGVQPEKGGVKLKVMGEFVPSQLATASLIVELSRKPMINLFWLGAFITFLSGALSMRDRRRKNRQTVIQDIDMTEPKREVVQ